MPGIGVISSIKFQGTPLETAFDAGLNMPKLYRATPQDDLGRNPGVLSAALATLVGDTSVTLIVSIGGIAIQEAGDRDDRKDYIALLGGIPTGGNPHGHHKGHLSLDSFLRHADRLQYLKSKWGIQPPQVCLLFNSSLMSHDDKAGFGNRIQEVQLAKNSTDALQQFQRAFANIGSNYQAVVVSADPFFLFNFRNELQQTAHAWVTGNSQRRICYPLQEYDLLSPTATGQTTLWGPPLYRDDASGALGAYKILGQKVANFFAPTKVAQLQQLHKDI